MALRPAVFCVLLGLACLATAVAAGDIVAEQQSLLPPNPVVARAVDEATGDSGSDIVAAQASPLPNPEVADLEEEEADLTPDESDFDVVADLELDDASEEEETAEAEEEEEGRGRQQAVAIARDLSRRLEKLRLDAIRRRGLTKRLRIEARDMRTAGANRLSVIKNLKDDIETLRAQEKTDRALINALQQKLDGFTTVGKSRQAAIEKLEDKEDDLLDKLARCKAARRSTAGARKRQLSASLRTVQVLKRQLAAVNKQTGPLNAANKRAERNRRLMASKHARALKKRSKFARGLPASCLAIKQANPKAKSGVYTIAGGLSKIGKVPRQCAMSASGRALFDKLAWKNGQCRKTNGGVYVGGGRTSYELLMTFPVSTVSKGMTRYTVVGKFWLAAQTNDNDPKFCLMNQMNNQPLACVCLGDRHNHRAWIIGGSYNSGQRRFQGWKTKTSMSYHKTPNYARVTWTVNHGRVTVQLHANGRTVATNFGTMNSLRTANNLVIGMFRNDAGERYLVRRAMVTSPGTASCEGHGEEKEAETGDLETSDSDEAILPRITGVWVPHQDAHCAARKRYHVAGNPVSVTTGSGYLLNPNVNAKPRGLHWGFGMHDHAYSRRHVPNPGRAYFVYRFSASVVVKTLKIYEHQNGIDEIEGFVGDSLNRMVSIGRSVGSQGRKRGSSQFREKSLNIFAFPKPRAGKFFKVIIRHTPLPNGWAFYRALPGFVSAKAAGTSKSGPLLFLADYYNSYSAIHGGIRSFWHNSWDYMKGASSTPTVATLHRNRDGFSLTGGGHNPAARAFFRKRAVIRTIRVVSDASLKNVDIFHIVMDAQGGRAKVPTLSRAEAKALKRFVRRGGAVYAFLGHQAERRAPHCGRWAKEEFGVIFDENSRCMSPGKGTPVGNWPTGFRRASVSWNSNCHENFKIAKNSKASAILRATGHTHCGHAHGRCDRGAINEAVVVPRGAYETDVAAHALGQKRRVYCDMDTEGGGWTMCLNSAWDKKGAGLFQRNYQKAYNGKPYGHYDFCPTDKKDYLFGITNSKKGKIAFLAAGAMLNARPHESGSRQGTSEWNEIGVAAKTVKWVVGSRRYLPRCQEGSATLKFWEYINPARRRLKGFKRGWFQCQGVPSNAKKFRGITYTHKLKGRAYFVHAHYWQWMMGAGCNYQTCSSANGGGAKGRSMHPSHWNYALKASAGLVNYARGGWQSRDEGRHPARLLDGQRFVAFYREAPRKEEVDEEEATADLEASEAEFAGVDKEQALADLDAVEADPYAKEFLQLAEACAYSRGGVHRAHCRRAYRARQRCKNKCQSLPSVRRLLGKAWHTARLKKRISRLARLYVYLKGTYKRDARRVRNRVIAKWKRRQRTPRTHLWPRRIVRRRRRRQRKNYGPSPMLLKMLRHRVNTLKKNAKGTRGTIAKMRREAKILSASKKAQLSLITKLRRQVKYLKSKGGSRISILAKLKKGAEQLRLSGLRLNSQLGKMRVSLAATKRKCASCEKKAKASDALSKKLGGVRARIAAIKRAIRIRAAANSVLKRRLRSTRVAHRKLHARHHKMLHNRSLGKSKARPARSCNDILKANTGIASGKYWVKVNGKVRQLYCDMTTDGGGWTLVYKAGGTGCGKLIRSGALNPGALAAGDLKQAAKLSDGDINVFSRNRPMRFVTSDEGRKFFFVMCKTCKFSNTHVKGRTGQKIRAKLTWSSSWRTGTYTNFARHGSCWLFDRRAPWATKSKRHAGEHICMRQPSAADRKCRVWMNGGMWDYRLDKKHKGHFYGSFWVR